jgi:sulfite dehydrogenase
VKQQGFSVQSMEDLIRGQIAYPEPPMPANLLHGQDANDVAAYIAKCAGNPQCGVTASKVGVGQTTSTTQTTTQGGGAGGGAQVAQGKQVFASAGCGGCHTLKDAGTNGTVGPNLDQLKPTKDRVARQVTNGGAIMPSFKSRLSKAQIEAVAAYVSSVAGK